MQIPVLIVGAGPAGLCTSIMLSRLGVRSILVERHAGTSVHPKATGISLRTMELLRQWGLDHQVREAAINAWFVNSVRETSLASPELKVMSLGFPDAAESRVVSPVAAAALAQDDFEPILLEAARCYTTSDLRFNTELATLRQDADVVHVTIVDRMTGRASRLEAQYVIAADGVSSAVRRELGIAMQGNGHLDEYISVLFRANLDHLTPAPMRGLYTLNMNGRTSRLLPTSGDGRWVYAMPWSKEQGAIRALTPAQHIEIVRSAIGDAEVDVDVLDVRAVELGAQVAERFRKGNVFLVGDAAHRTTPSGGMGMNTAIRGAHNLAWKIGAVLNGWAGPKLLDSYEAEHRPVAERNVARSIGQHRELSGLAVDLGAVYTSSAVLADDQPRADIMEPTAPARIGARAPHVFVKRGAWRCSTTDVSGRRMALIAAPRAYAWVRAMLVAARALDVPLEIIHFNPPCTDIEAAHRWHDSFGITTERAVLVRPDGHIAWITPATSLNPAALAADALGRILDRSANSHSAVGTRLVSPLQRRSA